MNPSAPGWIKKHSIHLLNHLDTHPMSDQEMYLGLRASGFIYGNSVSTLCNQESNYLNWTEEEKTKINLFDALVFTYYDTIEQASLKECLQEIDFFYQLLEYQKSVSKNIPSLRVLYSNLEKRIDRRVQTNEPLFKKNFSHLITNALLYIDVLAFEHYLLTDESPVAYAKDIEAVLLRTVWIALSRKQEKDTYNELLMKLFESSIRYNNWPLKTTVRGIKELSHIDQKLEKMYILDMCAMAVGNDQDVDSKERMFIAEVCEHLEIPASQKEEALFAIRNFIETHKNLISYLQYSNPIKHFYDQTSKTVSTLVLRNKNRLSNEISQSKELMVLLGQSAVRDLSKEEKKIVRVQLLDICKTVPSLAIFLLPGGGILMPLLIKFIPQLLPSAFNENRR